MPTPISTGRKHERIASEIFDAIHENVATKADIERLGARIDQVESGLRAEMREIELRLEARIGRVVMRLGALIVVPAGVILAGIRYLPYG